MRFVNVRPEREAHMETLTFYFPVVEGKDVVLRLQPMALRVR